MRRLLHVLSHPVASNALWLYGQQFAVTILPLVTLPYLTRVLGPSELGIVVVTQSFSFTLALVIEYGFPLTGPREAAARRGNPEALAETVAAVQGAKAALCGVAVLLGLAAWPLVPAFRAHPELVALALGTAVLQGMSPWWLFGGLEKMRGPATLELGLRVLTVVVILAVVDDRTDGALVLLVYLIVQGLSTLLLTGWMYRLVAPRAPDRAEVVERLRAGWILFVSSGAVAAYTTATVFLLGLLVTPAQVAFYAAAERVVRAGMRVLSAVEAAVYPRVSFLVASGRPERADRLALLTLGGLGGVSVLCAAALFLLAPVLVDVVFGEDFGPSVGVLRVLALVVPLGLGALTITQQWLLPRGLERWTTRVVLVAGALNIVLLLALTPLLGIRGTAWALVIVEAVTLVGQLLIMRRFGLLPRRRRGGERPRATDTSPRARRGAGSSA